MRRKPEEFYLLLGNRVRTFRQQKGLTQEQLGSRLTPSMTRASVANIETAKQRVLAHTLVQLSRALDVPVDDLTRAESPPVSDEVTEKLYVVLRKRLLLSEEQAQRFTESLGYPTIRREKPNR
jgi:transcriptional regulator with XRE-family HTH domain